MPRITLPAETFASAPRPPQVTEKFSVLNDIKSPFPHTGRSAAVTAHWHKDNAKECLDEKSFVEIEEATQKFFDDHGFSRAASPLRAHLVAVIYCDTFSTDVDKTVTHEKYENGVLVSQTTNRTITSTIEFRN